MTDLVPTLIREPWSIVRLSDTFSRSLSAVGVAHARIQPIVALLGETAAPGA